MRNAGNYPAIFMCIYKAGKNKAQYVKISQQKQSKNKLLNWRIILTKSSKNKHIETDINVHEKR